MSEIPEIHHDGFTARIWENQYGLYDVHISHWYAPIFAVGHGIFTLHEARKKVYACIKLMKEQMYRSERR